MNRKEQLEERLNTYSHGLGIILGIIGFAILLNKTLDSNSKYPIIIYGLSVVFLFLASTLYHAVSDTIIKKRLRIVDHISIYYLIAGTYTPVCLTLLKDSKGMLLLYIVWGIAFFGTILKLFFTGKFEAFSLTLYGVMGWLVVIDLPYLITHSSSKELFFLGLGGAFYTIGILFYAIKKIPFNHFIWHLFVLGGAISHWYFIYISLLSLL